MCNFELFAAPDCYQWNASAKRSPMWRIVCRMLVNESGTHDLEFGDSTRFYDDKEVRCLHVPVHLDLGALKSSSDVTGVFQRAHVRLLCTLTHGNLVEWLRQYGREAQVKYCISRWGRQDDGTMVSVSNS